jgi:hypothetical protein
MSRMKASDFFDDDESTDNTEESDGEDDSGDDDDDDDDGGHAVSASNAKKPKSASKSGSIGGIVGSHLGSLSLGGDLVSRSQKMIEWLCIRMHMITTFIEEALPCSE